MRNRRIWLIMISIVCITNIYAQGLSIRGIVKDIDGVPLIGASVTQKGTDHRTITDIDGNFSINAAPKSVLVFSYLGFQTKEVIAGKELMNITLTVDEHVLDDVIVVAYGTASKAGYTGSASTVGKAEISKSQVSNISRLLQGSASGVQAISASGQPGSDASVFIRGVGSINASSNPLYIVDGAPFEGNLNSINPADIESINVLKDAASTALYGSRAGNGLIVITTKQGKKEGKVKVDASFRYGFSSRAVGDYKKVSTNDYFQLYWEAMRNQELYMNGKSAEEAAAYASSNIVSILGINPYGSKYSQPVGLDGRIVSGAVPLWNDDWVKEYQQDAHRSEAQLGISGGDSKSTYYVSLSYLDDKGIVLSSDFKRYTGRINLNSSIRSWLRMSLGVTLTHSKQDSPESEDSSLSNTLNFARLMPDFYPIWVRNDDGSFKLDANKNRIYDYGDYRPSAASPRYNHLGSSAYDFNKVERDLASVRASLEIDLYKGLTYKGSINIDYTNKNDHNYINPVYGEGSYNDYPGSVSKYNYKTTGFTGNNVFTYKTTIQDVHNLKLLAGQEYFEFNTKNINGSRSGFPILGLSEPIAASQLESFTGKSDRYKLLSFFGNAEYNYNYKYYGSASIRTDGSSKFSPSARWGVFWSLGASWRINEENFLKENKSITYLTLRSSYGGQGNDNIDGYGAYRFLFDINNNLGESGFVSSSLGNKNLKWETNLNFNIGVDFGFFDKRLYGSAEFFNRRSKDLLFEIPKPLSIGYSSYPANIGAIKNTGFELSLTGVPVRTKDWQWDISVNATHFKNEITKLPQEEIITGNKVLRKGGTIYDFFLVEWAGVDKENGLPLWYKTTDDGKREATTNYNEANTTASKIIAGTSLPSLMGGFSTNLRYKDFEFSALFAYSLGGKIYNGDKISILANGSSAGRAMSEDLLNRWTPENTDTDVPRLQTTNSNSWTNSSTRFLIDADYLRMKNITLGYNIPRSLLKKLEIESLKVYAQAENLLTVFGTQGIDPEQTISGSTYYRYPAMKTISFGLNVSF